MVFNFIKVAKKSDFKNILEKAVINSNRWQKWLHKKEKDINSLDKERKELIIKTSCRYVRVNPEVKVAQVKLFVNLIQNGYDPENWILLKIEESTDKYFWNFNLVNINEKIENIFFK